MKRILFYSPFGSRTGSDMMLSYIIKHLDRKRFAPVVFSERAWPLLNNLKETIPVYSSKMESSRLNRFLDLTGRKIFDLSIYENQLLQIIKKHEPDLIYLNTIVAHKLIPVLKRINIPFITHCHELTYSYQSISEADLEFLIKKSRLMIGCSQQVCAQLSMMGAERVALVYEGIDSSRIPLTFSNSRTMRENLKIPLDATVWMMAGLRHYRKGFDLVPEIAEKIKSAGGWIVWLGKSFHTGYDILVKRNLAKDHSDNVVLIDEQDDDYFSWLQMADGLLLTSREDPFPLVMLEAAWLGKTIVAFSSGGVREFLTEGMGHITSPFDTDHLSKVLIEYSSGIRKSTPSVSIARAEEFEIQHIMKQWHSIIESAIA